METYCEYCQIVSGYGKLIWETDYWEIYLAPSQRYLGTCVVALKRKCRDLNEVKDTEWVDFANIVRKMEKSLKELFQPTLYNWSCFKNSVFRGENPEPEIHWHFIPRYKNSVEFEGMNFPDPDFGYIPLPVKREIPTEIMEKLETLIVKKMKKINQND